MRLVSSSSRAFVSARPGGKAVQLEPASIEYSHVPFAAPTFTTAIPGRSPSTSFQLPLVPVGSSAAIEVPRLVVALTAMGDSWISGLLSMTGAAVCAAIGARDCAPAVAATDSRTRAITAVRQTPTMRPPRRAKRRRHVRRTAGSARAERRLRLRHRRRGGIGRRSARLRRRRVARGIELRQPALAALLRDLVLAQLARRALGPLALV